jgi:hypothetical protein
MNSTGRRLDPLPATLAAVIDRGQKIQCSDEKNYP